MPDKPEPQTAPEVQAHPQKPTRKLPDWLINASVVGGAIAMVIALVAVRVNQSDTGDPSLWLLCNAGPVDGAGNYTSLNYGDTPCTPTNRLEKGSASTNNSATTSNDATRRLRFAGPDVQIEVPWHEDMQIDSAEWDARIRGQCGFFSINENTERTLGLKMGLDSLCATGIVEGFSDSKLQDLASHEIELGERLVEMGSSATVCFDDEMNPGRPQRLKVPLMQVCSAAHTE